MAVSRTTERRNSETLWERVIGQLTRYDLVLTVIPLVFSLAVVATTALSVPFLAALAGGAVVSSLVLADALFVNPPIDSGSEL
ncbi:hypothetical protein [Halovenus sp. HT40]|uniref:hypothetical protein n=1 Tax=Halovenus sp. HT40 TaxID=3126691 RepID=UPI00300EDE72